MINPAQYKLAKFLDQKIKSLLSSKYECKDSSNFVVSSLTARSIILLTSFDIVNLFTNVPLNKVINQCCDLWESNSAEHSMLSVTGFKKLLTFATSNISFLFNDEWYKQIYGVAMISSLALTLA